MTAKIVAVKLIELAKRLIKFDKQLGVYHNGIDNNYPERVERIINNSATAKPAAKLFRKYITGKGLGEIADNFIVYNLFKISLRKFLSNVAHSYSYHNGVFIHVNYNLNYKIVSLDVLPYSHCRKGKSDDKKYSGKIIIYDNWDQSNGPIDKNKFEILDAYNPNQNVIKAQIEKAGDITKYKGQVFFFNPDPTIYPLAHIDNVLDDADSEKMSSVYKNNSLRKGFFGKKIFITPPMLDTDLRVANENLNNEQLADKRFQETERDNFKKSAESFIGADNAHGMLHLEMEFDGDDIDKAMKIINVETNINDALFKHTEVSCAANIRKAYANIPAILIENQGEGAMFGQSGEMLVQAKLFYNDQTEEDRDKIENEILKPLLSNFQDFKMPSEGLKILPIIEVTTSNKLEESKAILRGSVGGVTALLAIQQSVANGTTDIESGIAIIEEIYGIEEPKARKMLGKPTIKNPENEPID